MRRVGHEHAHLCVGQQVLSTLKGLATEHVGPPNTAPTPRRAVDEDGDVRGGYPPVGAVAGKRADAELAAQRVAIRRAHVQLLCGRLTELYAVLQTLHCLVVARCLRVLLRQMSTSFTMH